MPIDGLQLRVEPTFPNAEGLNAIGAREENPHELATHRNTFYSTRWRCDIVVWNETEAVGDERVPIEWGKIPRVHGAPMLINTLDASHVWGLEQEGRAVNTLGTLLRHHAFKAYLLTGSFVERSKRTGLFYMFRKLRPTLVMQKRGPISYEIGETSARRVRNPDELHIVCCLCMHPIAYYAQSWAGAMCPTDDVIAHLMMMRGDEPMLWRRSNQHSPAMPEAGLS